MNGNLRRLVMVNTAPQKVCCQPVTNEDGFTPPQHEFLAMKVYVLLDECGYRQDGIVICPDHNQPISVKVVRQPRTEGVV